MVSWFLESIVNMATAPIAVAYVLWNFTSNFDLSDPAALARFIYYGASRELFFVLFDLFLFVLIIGLWRRRWLRAVVDTLEAGLSGLGKIAAWAGILMVLQQAMVIFLQAIFRLSDITIAPFGLSFSRSLSWYGDSLKFYNAMIICLCCAYTFIQGGHVRVDLIYARVRYRTRKIIDMAGALFFMVPMLMIIWLYGWFFLWRHLITPKISATDRLDLIMRKARLLRWNIETTGFSPNGFDAYFLFKLLIVLFAGTMLLQAVTFFFRSLLDYCEGEQDPLPVEDEAHRVAESAAIAPPN